MSGSRCTRHVLVAAVCCWTEALLCLARGSVGAMRDSSGVTSGVRACSAQADARRDVWEVDAPGTISCSLCVVGRRRCRVWQGALWER
jgi:hypothetical protein